MIKYIFKNLLLIGVYIDNIDICIGMFLIRFYKICSFLYYFEGIRIFIKRSLYVVI